MASMKVSLVCATMSRKLVQSAMSVRKGTQLRNSPMVLWNCQLSPAGGECPDRQVGRAGDLVGQDVEGREQDREQGAAGSLWQERRPGS